MVMHPDKDVVLSATPQALLSVARSLHKPVEFSMNDDWFACAPAKIEPLKVSLPRETDKSTLEAIAQPALNLHVERLRDVRFRFQGIFTIAWVACARAVTWLGMFLSVARAWQIRMVYNQDCMALKDNAYKTGKDSDFEPKSCVMNMYVIFEGVAPKQKVFEKYRENIRKTIIAWYDQSKLEEKLYSKPEFCGWEFEPIMDEKEDATDISILNEVRTTLFLASTTNLHRLKKKLQADIIPSVNTAGLLTSELLLLEEDISSLTGNLIMVFNTIGLSIEDDSIAEAFENQAIVFEKYSLVRLVKIGVRWIISNPCHIRLRGEVINQCTKRIMAILNEHGGLFSRSALQASYWFRKGRVRHEYEYKNRDCPKWMRLGLDPGDYLGTPYQLKKLLGIETHYSDPLSREIVMIEQPIVYHWSYKLSWFTTAAPWRPTEPEVVNLAKTVTDLVGTELNYYIWPCGNWLSFYLVVDALHPLDSSLTNKLYNLYGISDYGGKPGTPLDEKEPLMAYIGLANPSPELDAALRDHPDFTECVQETVKLAWWNPDLTTFHYKLCDWSPSTHALIGASKRWGAWSMDVWKRHTSTDSKHILYKLHSGINRILKW